MRQTDGLFQEIPSIPNMTAGKNLDDSKKAKISNNSILLNVSKEMHKLNMQISDRWSFLHKGSGTNVANHERRDGF